MGGYQPQRYEGHAERRSGYFRLCPLSCPAWRKNSGAKPLRGFSGAGVLEIVDDYSSNTYRAVYTVRFADAVYVLHVFQKKSKHGIATPKEEIEKVKASLKIAEEMHGGKRTRHHE